MIVVAHALHDGQGFAEFQRCLVGALLGGKSLEHIGDGHDPRRDRHLVTGESKWKTGAIHFFMVAARIFRYLAQFGGKRQ